METITQALPVKATQIVIVYQKKDISAVLSPTLLSLTYTDKLKGESDELELQLDDADGKWRGAWYPQKGDLLSVKIGYKGEPLLPCGDFEIDETEHDGPPDTVTIRALATSIKADLRTKRSQGYEKQSLKEIAQKVASRNNLKLMGMIADIKFERITQHQEPDLAFLKRLAEGFGYTFSVRGESLVFQELAELDKEKAVLKIYRKDLKAYSLKDKSQAVYRSCTVSYHDPKTGKLVTHTEKADGIEHGDTFKLTERRETKAQAEARAKAALRASHGRQTEGSITLEGDPRVVSGNNLELPNMGKLSGIYQIREARHTIDREGGWSVEAEVQRVS
jgi:phage protein D